MPMNPRLLRPQTASGSAGDSDVVNYIAAVEIADGQALEQAVKDAIRDFILGCKTDNIWTAIKASCILMGARTLSGALTPLVGAAPTNNNFVSGDYNRKTGLKGNGNNKSLNSNRNNNADPQNDFHLAVWSTDEPNDLNSVYAGAGFSIAARQAGGSALFGGPGALLYTECRTDGFTAMNPNVARGSFVNALFGITRNASGSWVARMGTVQSTHSVASQTPFNGNIFIFAGSDANGAAASLSNIRSPFYSIGTSLTLSTLQSRVSALVTAIGAAIP